MLVSPMLPEIPVAPAARARQRGVAFTKATIARMWCKPGKPETFYWDEACRGFGLRAMASKKRSWVFQYRNEAGHTRRMTLGDLTAVSLEAAREAARQVAANVVQGSDPSDERRAKRQALRVGAAIEAYLEHAEQKQRPRSYKETTRYLKKHAKALHSEHVDTVPRHVIAALLDRAASRHGNVAANRLRAHLSAFFNWAIMTGRSVREANPVTHTIRHGEVPKARVLSDVELKAIWNATGGAAPYDRIVRLCLLTGCRREEIGGLQWSEIGDEWIVIDGSRMKGREAHEIALLPAIMGCLPPRPADGGVVFSRVRRYNGFSHGKKRLDEKLAKAGHQFAPWGLHDLRRTMSTRLNDADAPPMPHVVEALLAHKLGGVAAIYNYATLRKAKREALAKWHEMLAGIVA